MTSREFERRERGLQELGELRTEHIVSSFVRSAEGSETVEKLRACERGEAVIRAPLPRQVLGDEISMGKGTCNAKPIELFVENS